VNYSGTEFRVLKFSLSGGKKYKISKERFYIEPTLRIGIVFLPDKSDAISQGGTTMGTRRIGIFILTLLITSIANSIT